MSIPGWLSIDSEESERVIAGVEVCESLWRQYEGCGGPFPKPSVRYDIESVLYSAPPRTARESVDLSRRQPNFERLIEEFYARALEAFRALTEPDDFVF